MQIQIAPDADSYGRFLVVMAALDTQINDSMVEITGSPFEDVQWIRFPERCKRIREYARKVAETFGKPEALTDTLQGRSFHTLLLSLEDALDIAERVQEWRNARVHARVRFDGAFLSLTDREGNSVDFRSQSFEKPFREALFAACSIPAHLKPIIQVEKPDFEFFRLMDEGVPELSYEDYVKSLAELRAELGAPSKEEPPKQNS